MKKILLYIWQLPQNIYGLILRLIWPAEKKLVYRDKTIRINSKFPSGISLGETIIVKKYPTNKELWKDVKHEYGHSRQSEVYGLFYLLIIALPSGLYNIVDRIITLIIGYEKSYKLYYNMPWEKGADKRGGVER